MKRTILLMVALLCTAVAGSVSADDECTGCKRPHVVAKPARASGSCEECPLHRPLRAEGATHMPRPLFV